MLKFFTNPASNYACLKTFKRANFMILPTREGSGLVKGIKMKKTLKFAPSRLVKSLTYDNNWGNQSIFKVNIQK